MAPSTETEPNPYELLGISQEATEAEIRTAYRTRSLKVHPDRNRNDPDAARKFHELTNASNLLLDPLRRLALDAQLRLAAAKKARFAAYDVKRKNLVTELEEREREFKKARLEKEKERAARAGENERVKEAGRRLKEERERELEERERTRLGKARVESPQDEMEPEAPPSLGPYDTTIRVKFSLAKHPTLNAPSTLAAHFRRFGDIDEGAIVLSLKPKKSSKKNKSETQEKENESKMIVNALVTFTQISAAFGVVSSGPRLKEQGMDVSWAGGTEPPILQWLRDRGQLGGTTNNSSPKEPSANGSMEERQGAATTPPTTNLEDGSKFSSFPSTFPTMYPPNLLSSNPAAVSSIMDYESLTLLRLREAERAKLEREILEAEAREEDP
ncbi:DnaJ domain-containing protein [Scleroderma yunnanense]